MRTGMTNRRKELIEIIEEGTKAHAELNEDGGVVLTFTSGYVLGMERDAALKLARWIFQVYGVRPR